jgi:peptidylprolyl isomerase
LRAVKALLTAIAASTVLAFAGCGDDDSTESDTGAGETIAAQSDLTDTKTKPAIEVPEGEPPTVLVEEDLVEGSGPSAKKGDEVTVQYVGVGYESGEEFDASWGGEPFSFQLGGGQVIKGWDEGVEGMKAGGRRQLTIPPDLGYGEAGFPPAIGPNETLIFVVDLVAIK